MIVKDLLKIQKEILESIKVFMEDKDITIENIKEFRSKYFGSSGIIKIQFLSQMRNLSNEDKKSVGNIIKEITLKFEESLNAKEILMIEKKWLEKMNNEKVDLSANLFLQSEGSIHPLNIILYKVNEIFRELGYIVLSGFEVEKDTYNFEVLNIPKNHPAREMQDSFFINENLLLRTHCTNMTARYLTNADKNSPLRVISTGNVYRKDDDDATHSHQFTQIDVFNVGNKISLSNLKWTLEYFVKKMFNDDTKIRMRPSFFPFTEPSMEVDVTCVKCQGDGCWFCKNSGWIEILGAGMLHPNVIKACGHDPNKLTGFAFGVGVERIALLKYDIDDIRSFYKNDIRFLKQFKSCE